MQAKLRTASNRILAQPALFAPQTSLSSPLGNQLLFKSALMNWPLSVTSIDNGDESSMNLQNILGELL